MCKTAHAEGDLTITMQRSMFPAAMAFIDPTDLKITPLTAELVKVNPMARKPTTATL
jgi:hypothetical protein